MKFHSILAAALLLGGSAVAAPGAATELASLPGSSPVTNFHRHSVTRRDMSSQAHSIMARDGNQTEVHSTINWAGASLLGKDITQVSGVFSLPTLNTEGQGAAWVALDSTCKAAMLQAGITWEKTGDTSTYYGWYSWDPEGIINVDSKFISFSTGDQVKITVTSNDPLKGAITYENLTTKKSYTYTFKKGPARLCHENALWMLQNWVTDTKEPGGKPVQFADFGSLTFTSPSAIQNGSPVGPKDSIMYLMTNVARSVYITDVTITDDKIDIISLPEKESRL